MSRLQDALARLDTAMIRLDRAAAEGQARGASQRHLLEGELATLREAYEALEGEARRVAERLDEIIERLAAITGEAVGAAAPEAVAPVLREDA